MNIIKEINLNDPNCLAFSNDSQYLIVGGQSPYDIYIYETQNFKLVKQL